jgi:hypothetical protein
MLQNSSIRNPGEIIAKWIIPRIRIADMHADPQPDSITSLTENVLIACGLLAYGTEFCIAASSHETAL